MTLLIIFGILVAYLVVGVLMVVLFIFLDNKFGNKSILDQDWYGVAALLWPLLLIICVELLFYLIPWLFSKCLTMLIVRLSGRKD